MKCVNNRTGTGKGQGDRFLSHVKSEVITEVVDVIWMNDV